MSSQAANHNPAADFREMIIENLTLGFPSMYTMRVVDKLAYEFHDHTKNQSFLERIEEYSEECEGKLSAQLDKLDDEADKIRAVQEFETSTDYVMIHVEYQNAVLHAIQRIDHTFHVRPVEKSRKTLPELGPGHSLRPSKYSTTTYF
jgi:hypothetical protein